jgi:hypothetical protein
LPQIVTENEAAAGELEYFIGASIAVPAMRAGCAPYPANSKITKPEDAPVNESNVPVNVKAGEGIFAQFFGIDDD